MNLRKRAVLLAALILVALLPRFRFNYQYSSVPKGIYFLSSGELARGRLVLICLGRRVEAQTLSRSYGKTGRCPGGSLEALKTIAALPGDTVRVTSLGLRVNGELLPATLLAFSDTAGRRLPRPASLSTVPPGQVWVHSATNGASWDSRYFGGVPLEGIRALARPVWTSSR